MDPIIDEVDWYYLSALPRGIRFDEETGTFTGTPRTVGEYTIPIKVQTNYGVDTKNVKIIVEGTPHPVYTIGTRAKTWSTNAEPDEYGFYPLPIPNAYRLLSHPYGFLAYCPNNEHYCCGWHDFNTNYGGGLTDGSVKVYDTPARVDDIAQVQSGHLQQIIGDYKYKSCFYLLTKYMDGTMSFQTDKVLYSTSKTSGSYQGRLSRKISSGDYKLEERGYIPNTMVNGVSWLSDNGTVVTSINLSPTLSTITLSIKTEELGFRAIKKFSPNVITDLVTALSDINKNTAWHIDVLEPVFYYLSENYYLDNDPSKFRIGNIKDAWCFGKVAYVQTDNNNFYSYYNGIWQYEGNYDIKKLEIYTSARQFILTKDGKLYHKGQTDSGVITEKHDTFTQIFPECTFYDFTYTGSTLTVLKD